MKTPFPDSNLPANNPPCTCDNCGITRVINALNPINTRTFWQRVQPGALLPAGECPDCGAFAYLDPEPNTEDYNALLDAEEDSCILDCGCRMFRPYDNGSVAIKFCAEHNALPTKYQTPT